MRIAITSSALRALAEVGKPHQTGRASARSSGLLSRSSAGPMIAAVFIVASLFLALIQGRVG